LSPEERLELIYNAALGAKNKQEELIGLLGSIMWLAGDLTSSAAFNDEEIEKLLKDKDALRTKYEDRIRWVQECENAASAIARRKE
jgi:hypothetical protein